MIENMTTQEKTIALAHLIGWSVDDESTHVTGCKYTYITDKETGDWLRVTTDSTFYHTKHMQLAWRVLNWAANNMTTIRSWSPVGNRVKEPAIECEFISWIDCGFLQTPPAEAQAAWLDKILELAIDAGMVKRD